MSETHEGYQPTEKEMKSAEESVTENQKHASHYRRLKIETAAEYEELKRELGINGNVRMTDRYGGTIEGNVDGNEIHLSPFFTVDRNDSTKRVKQVDGTINGDQLSRQQAAELYERLEQLANRRKYEELREQDTAEFVARAQEEQKTWPVVEGDRSADDIAKQLLEQMSAKPDTKKEE